MSYFGFKTNVSITPPLRQKFSPYLLLDSLGRIDMNYKKIIQLASKKIRPQDVGKLKELEKLIKTYSELYERKKNERSDYETALKEKAKKRPSLPITGSIMRFRRNKAD